jgi:hypothetical protein
VTGLQVARVALRDMPSRVLLGPLSGQALVAPSQPRPPAHSPAPTVQGP